MMEDVKGAFNIVKRKRLIKQLARTVGGRKWRTWVESFMGKRAFTVEWDGKTRGKGEAGEGVPQGSPLSPTLFLIYLAPTIHKMEVEIRKAIPGLQVEINSYVDDIVLSIIDEDGMSDMSRIVKKGAKIMREIAEADGIPFEKEKEETIVFGIKGNKLEKVKWLGIILDSKLKFQDHLEVRVKRLRQMLGNLKGLGNSAWGLNPASWRQAYTGMIRTIALWGAEVGWRGQEKWRKALKNYNTKASPSESAQGHPRERRRGTQGNAAGGGRQDHRCRTH